MTKNSETPDVELITSESKSSDDLGLDGSYFEKLIYFIKVKILSIISIILVTNSIKTDDTKMDLSIKYIITSLLILSVILLISGFFEFIHTINQYKSKHKKEFNWMDWVISFLVGFMYMITCGIVFLYIRYQYTKLK